MINDIASGQPKPAKSESIPPLLIRVEEAARILSLGRSTVYQLMDQGVIPYVKCGAARRIPIAALYAWVAANTQ